MSPRRRAANLAQVKADVAALETPDAQPLPWPGLRRRWVLLLLSVLSPVALQAAFPPFDQWYVAYVALVPWAAAVVGARTGRWAALCAAAGGVVFWGLGVYWLTWVTGVGYGAMIPYLTSYWLVAGLLLRRAVRRGWPAWLCLPVVWVALEYARGFALSGFPWFYLAHSQHTLAPLIQIADTTGQYGVSFFVAMVNGAVLDIALAWVAPPSVVGVRLGVSSGGHGGPEGTPPSKQRLGVPPRIAVPVLACVVAAGGMLGYGALRLGEQTTRPGPKVGLVQQAIPISLFAENLPAQVVFDRHVAASRELVGAGCDLVVWPESMLGFHFMDPAIWPSEAEAADENRYSPAFREHLATYRQNFDTLRDLIKELGCPVLAGGGMPPQTPLGRAEHLTTNAALLFDRDAEGKLVVRRRYDKMHLVPFGEYVPFAEGWPWLHRLLRQFVPAAMPQLEPGREIVVFPLACRGEAPPSVSSPGGGVPPSGGGPSRPASGPATDPALTRPSADLSQRERSLSAPPVPAQGTRFAVPICYEGVFDRLCRAMVMQAGQKRLDLLVNISNDGWFVYPIGRGQGCPSTELDQHLAQYVFRAVETRVPVVRAVNTGISAYIDSCGRVQARVGRAGRGKMVNGNLAAQTLVDGRVSPYSQAGDAFALAVSAAAIVGAGLLLWRRRAARQES